MGPRPLWDNYDNQIAMHNLAIRAQDGGNYTQKEMRWPPNPVGKSGIFRNAHTPNLTSFKHILPWIDIGDTNYYWGDDDGNERPKRDTSSAEIRSVIQSQIRV